MPINFGLYDTNNPMRLADLLNPEAIRGRQAQLQNAEQANLAQQLAMANSAEQLRNAPVTRQRAEADFQYQQQQRAAAQAEAQRVQQERLQKQEMLKNATPEQQKMLMLGVPPEKVFIPKEPKDWQNPAYIGYQKEMEKYKASLHPNAATSAPQKPLPVAALKLQQEELDAIGTASSLNKDLGAFATMIESGKLPLGLITNLGYKARNMAGSSSPESRNYASFQANLERLRNESLRLNKGVQTEGDAVRAWNEILANINDDKLVAQRLKEVQKVNERAINLRKMQIDSIRSNYGKDPIDVTGREEVPAAYGEDSQWSDL